MMIEHVVLLNWKEGVTPAEIHTVTSGFKVLKNNIKQIQSYRFGPDAGFYKGNADYALVAEFDNQDDLKAYVDHPLHQAFLKDTAGPLLASFQSVQFEVINR